MEKIQSPYSIVVYRIVSDNFAKDYGWNVFHENLGLVTSGLEQNHIKAFEEAVAAIARYLSQQSETDLLSLPFDELTVTQWQMLKNEQDEEPCIDDSVDWEGYENMTAAMSPTFDL